MKTLQNLGNYEPLFARPERNNDPFKKDDDNDPTRIRPHVNEPEKNDPAKIDPAIPEEEKIPGSHEQTVIDPSIPEEKGGD